MFLKKHFFCKSYPIVPIGLAILFLFTCSSDFADDSTPLIITPSTVYPPTPEATSPSSPSEKDLERAGPEFLKDRAWLMDLYSWKESFDLNHQSVEANKTGAYCIGNGRTFALIGLFDPLWTWSNIYGATYQAPELGSLRMAITRTGSETSFSNEQIGWVRRSGVVKVVAEAKDFSVETYDFAPVSPSENNAWDNLGVLVRLVHFTNKGAQTENDLGVEFKIQPIWNAKIQEEGEGRDLLLQQRDAKDKKHTVWRLGSFGTRYVKTSNDSLQYNVPPLRPGEETWVAFFLLSANSSDENKSFAVDIRKKGPVELLDETRDYYTDWFEKGTSFSGDAKISDLFEIESLIFKSQQCQTGGFSPLIGYSYTWIRDNNGPIRWFLKTGHPQEAKRAMDLFYGVASTMGSLPNSVRVDYKLDYHLKDLSKIHVEHSETPNWVVLQHWWYYQTTGDLELIRARWNYLRRCVFGQLNVEDKYFFQRDETYLWCLESRIFDQINYPNYYLSTFAFSADSSFELVSAADHLSYMGKYLEMDKDVSSLKKLSEEVRAKTEETYWNDKAGYWEPAESLLGPLYNAPFANILLNPFWCGYARNDLDPIGETPEITTKAIQAFKSAYPWLGREDGFWKTTPTVDFYVGMNPGQLLYDFCKARLPWADKAYPAVLKTASPSGDFSEMYDAQYHPWNRPSLGLGTSGRVRPWEGGLDTESLLEYIIGFSPDAGNAQVVFSPHLPEGMDEFSAQRLLVGIAKVSISMKRLDSKKWTVTLHLDRGEKLDVTMDFWASRRLLSDIEITGDVTWDKALADTNGREGRFQVPLEADKDLSFTIIEGSKLPSEESTPPKPQVFLPEPYSVKSGELLLLTSPTALLNQHNYKYVDPINFVPIGASELETLKKVNRSISFLDLDLPISPEDIANALLDEKGNPKFKFVVFGKGAFSSGNHHFKPETYWANPKIGQAIKNYLEAGGCLFLGPSYPNREVLPEWLINLTGGGWEEGTVPDKVIVAQFTKMQANQKLLDEVDINNPGSESSHAVSFEGETFEDTQNLPDSQNEKRMIQDQGRGFTGYYQFTLKTAPGIQHRLWIRVNTGHNIKGMALQVQVDGQWKQVGVRTQDGGPTRHFLALYFDIPENLITGTQTLFRVISKTGDEVNLYHLWLYKVEGAQSIPLPQALGFSPNQEIGKVNHGLLPHGNELKAPLLLSRYPDQAALLIQKVGKGYFLRSELSLEDTAGLFKTLLKQSTLDTLADSWAGQ